MMPFMSRYRLSNLRRGQQAKIEHTKSTGRLYAKPGGSSTTRAEASPHSTAGARARTLVRWGWAETCQRAPPRPAGHTAHPQPRRESSWGSAGSASGKTPALPAPRKQVRAVRAQRRCVEVREGRAHHPGGQTSSGNATGGMCVLVRGRVHKRRQPMESAKGRRVKEKAGARGRRRAVLPHASLELYTHAGWHLRLARGVVQRSMMTSVKCL